MSISVENYFNHNYPSFSRWPSLVRNGVLSFFKRAFHEDEINDVLVKNRHLDAFDFIEFVLDYFSIDITINKNQLSRIPSYGRVVIIANHPLGALDSLALLNVIKDVRKDIKIVASNFLEEFKNLDEVLIPIENVKGKMQRGSVEAIYEALFTQKLILTPSIDIEAYSKDNLEMGIGSGFSNLTLGARLRYEFLREFAPYIGVQWSKNFGNTNDVVPLDEVYVTAGFRFWF